MYNRDLAGSMGSVACTMEDKESSNSESDDGSNRPAHFRGAGRYVSSLLRDVCTRWLIEIGTDKGICLKGIVSVASRDLLAKESPELASKSAI